MIYKSKSNWGDHVGSQLRGPSWSPYAAAIAEHYPIQVPWFYTLPSNLVEGVTFQDRRTVITSPQQHDVLIFGAYAIVRGGQADEGSFILLQITHEETGIPWAVPNVIGAALLPAIAGTAATVAPLNLISVLKLPEAFFLPRHNRLKLDWAQAVLQLPSDLDALITFVGVQLIGAKAPREITMPDGKTIPVGSRLPWFITLVMGSAVRFQQWTDWTLTANREFLQFTAPQDCRVEIHDVYFNRRVPAIGLGENFVTKLTEMGDAGIRTPQRAPIFAWTGGAQQVNPALPFTEPFLLRSGRRLLLAEQTTVSTLFNAVTFRGVRLCQY